MENKYEVGQKVRLSRDPEYTFGVQEGDVGVIIEVDDTQREHELPLLYNIEFDDGLEQCVDEDSLELNTKFKVGDEVNIIMSKNPYVTTIKNEYVTGIITKLNPNIRGDYSIDVDFDNGDVENLGFYESEIEAIEENTSKYIGSDKENEFLYTGGETVVVTDEKEGYCFYPDFADKMGLPNYKKGCMLKEGDVGTVVGYLPHEVPNYDQIVGIDIDGKQYLISIKGVEKIEEFTGGKIKDVEYIGTIQWAFDKLNEGKRVQDSQGFEVTLGGMDYLKHKDDSEYLLCQNNLTGWSLVEEDDEYSNKYTVGQYVRIVNNTDEAHYFDIGAIGVIVKIEGFDYKPLPYNVKIVDKKQWVDVEDIEALE